MPILPVQILRPGGRLPTRAHPDDAGWDFYAPEDAAVSGAGNVVPLGVAVAVPPGHVLVLKDRSGKARDGLRVSAGVIDAGYRGEVAVLLDAVGDPRRPGPVLLRAGDRVCQGLLLELPPASVELVDELPPPAQSRGGFGSTGR